MLVAALIVRCVSAVIERARHRPGVIIVGCRDQQPVYVFMQAVNYCVFRDVAFQQFVPLTIRIPIVLDPIVAQLCTSHQTVEARWGGASGSWNLLREFPYKTHRRVSPYRWTKFLEPTFGVIQTSISKLLSLWVTKHSDTMTSSSTSSPI